MMRMRRCGRLWHRLGCIGKEQRPESHYYTEYSKNCSEDRSPDRWHNSKNTQDPDEADEQRGRNKCNNTHLPTTEPIGSVLLLLSLVLLLVYLHCAYLTV